MASLSIATVPPGGFGKSSWDTCKPPRSPSGRAGGLTVEDVVTCYPEAVAGGEVSDWQQLLRQHAELDAELHAWLADKDRWEFAFRRDPLGKPHSRGASRAQK
ncbi:MAG TPA: hypothetical protein VKI65_16615 [Gemmataceae bacterium]|nr:hypothetical protein [Gemmataceae bacterium]